MARSSIYQRNQSMSPSIKGFNNPGSSIINSSIPSESVFDEMMASGDGGDNVVNKEVKNKKMKKLEEEIRILK